MCNIVTFFNWTGLTISNDASILMSPRLNESLTGSGTVSDPGVFQYSFELTDAQVTDHNLPDLTSDKEVTCYMSNEPFNYGSIQHNTNILNVNELSAVTIPIQPPSGSNNPLSPNTPTGDNTSGAKNLIRNTAIVPLLTLLGLLAIY